jgi:hypothetical protein
MLMESMKRTVVKILCTVFREGDGMRIVLIILMVMVLAACGSGPSFHGPEPQRVLAAGTLVERRNIGRDVRGLYLPLEPRPSARIPRLRGGFEPEEKVSAGQESTGLGGDAQIDHDEGNRLCGGVVADPDDGILGDVGRGDGAARGGEEEGGDEPMEATGAEAGGGWGPTGLPPIGVERSNDDSTISKLSARSQGYFEDDFLQHFAAKKLRRAPLINAGYSARVEFIRGVVRNFIGVPMGQPGVQKVQVVSLGCGFDTSYLQLKKEGLLDSTTWVDIDRPGVVSRKAAIIRSVDR